jgi:hypothetical protein
MIGEPFQWFWTDSHNREYLTMSIVEGMIGRPRETIEMVADQCGAADPQPEGWGK